MAVNERIRKLGLTLPPPPKPVGSYIPAVRVDHLLFLSGMIPLSGGTLAWEGRVGEALTIQEAQQAAQMALLNALAVIQAELGGLERVERIVRLGGFVASSRDFIQQPQVLNGVSDLLVEIFGEAGRHARMAVGVDVLPLNAPVELELIVSVRRD